MCGSVELRHVKPLEIESTDFGAKGEQNMTKGPNGEKRPADAIGRAVMVARIATGEERDTGYVSKNRRNSGIAGAEARMRNTDAITRSEIAAKAANARWRKENDMIETQSAKSKLSALYARKREAGLIDVKFLVGSIDEASFDDVANEVLRLEEAVQRGNYRVIRFNDKH